MTEEPKTRTVSLEEIRSRLMNLILSDGGEFCKCANCGDVYPLGSLDDDEEPWMNETVCGERCHDAYVAYLNDPRQW